MEVRNIRWVGVPASNYDAMVTFLREVLALRVNFSEPTTTEFSTSEGDEQRGKPRIALGVLADNQENHGNRPHEGRHEAAERMPLPGLCARYALPSRTVVRCGQPYKIVLGSHVNRRYPS
jgi:hypothetical protein